MEDIKTVGRNRLANAAKLLDFGMGTTVNDPQQSEVEGKFNDVYIIEVNASYIATAPCLRRDEDKPAGPTTVAISVFRRSLNIYSLEKSATGISSPWCAIISMGEDLISTVNFRCTFHKSLFPLAQDSNA